MARPFGSLPTRFELSSDAIGVAFVLPGSHYSPSAPALEFARHAGNAVRAAMWHVFWNPDVAADVGEPVCEVLETARATEQILASF